MLDITSFKVYVKTIVALEPCYGKEGGNATRVYTRDGQIYEESRRLLTILKKTVHHYGADLTRLRKKYKDSLGCAQAIALPLSRYLVLVPLKMRLPLIEHDGASGYVNLCAVTEVVDAVPDLHDYAKCFVKLQGGLSVPCCFTREFTEKRLTIGRLALEQFCYLQEEYRYFDGEQMVKEKAGEEALDTLTTISKLLFQLLTAKKHGDPVGE